MDENKLAKTEVRRNWVWTEACVQKCEPVIHWAAYDKAILTKLMNQYVILLKGAIGIQGYIKYQTSNAKDTDYQVTPLHQRL